MNSKLILMILVSLFCGMLAKATIAQNKESFTLVASSDCGNDDHAQPFLIKGESYKFDSKTEKDESVLTCNFGGTLIYGFDKMDIDAKYKMELIFYVDAERVMRLSADGNEICSPITVPAHKRVKKVIELPLKSYAYSQLVLILEATKGPNAVLSEIKIYSTNPQKLVAFEGSRKEALKQVKAYAVNKDVDVEKVIPEYAPVPSSLKGAFASKVSLNGVWEFCETDKGDEWSPINVPGQWSMQGFKVDSAGFGMYRKKFIIPQDWQDKIMKIRFDAVHSECIVSLNGKEIGRHEGGMTAFEYDITNEIQKGNNEISLKVRSESTSDMLGSLTQYAAHQLGGITRKVTLFALPKVYISDTRVVTDLDEKYKNAKLKLYIEITNTLNEDVSDAHITVNLAEHDFSKSFKLPQIKKGERWSAWLESDIESPKLWDNEHPHLYTLNLQLSKNKEVLQQNQKRIGFKEVEVVGNRMLVNGIPVKLRGVCRHEAHPTMGRAITNELRRLDVELYMKANCNFVRTSHYPPGEEFLEACDELGIFVEVESPICWIGHHANYNWRKLNYQDSKWYDYVLQANMETIHFYRNHPSVLFWSIANESYWNREFAQVQVYVEKADPSRPFAFHDQGYGGFNNQGSTAPVSNIHYPGPNGYKNDAVKNCVRPIVYGEYCHLNVYNRKELVTDPGVRSDWALALAPTWDNMYKTDAILGGSIWSGIDDVFQLLDGNAVGYGEWGPIDAWRRPKPEYWDMKKIYSPIKVYTKELSPSNLFVIEIENRYTFSNFKELEITYQYGKEQGRLFVDLASGKKGKIEIPVTSQDGVNTLSLSFMDSKGFVADEFVIPVGEQTQNIVLPANLIKTRFSKKESVFVIKGDQFECIVNSKTGQIQSMKKGGKETITGGPWFMMLPLTGGGCFPNHNVNTPIFNDVCTDWKAESVQIEKTEKGVLVKVKGAYKEAKGTYEMLVNAGGALGVTYDFESLKDINPRQVGMVFETKGDYSTTFWRRNGMWSVYPDDHISRPEGEALLTYAGVAVKPNPRIKPLWSWSKDQNELGSSDFRSTRRNIWYGGLKSDMGGKITVISNGEQHWRSWCNGERINFLVADFVTAGAEMFLGSFYAPYRKPIKVGDIVKGQVTIKLEN